jgi:pimeloyl-ACP methyl ester carboxylesterase
LTRTEYDAAGQRLASRVRNSTSGDPSETDRGKYNMPELMNALMPYYLAEPRSRPFKFTFYSQQLYDRVAAQMPDFDFRDIRGRLPSHLLAVYGEQDFELPEGTSNLHEFLVQQLDIVRSCGHFPFAEQPEKFATVLSAFLSKV